MNNKMITIVFTLLLTASPFALAHEAHCEDTELGNNMSQMKKQFKSLKKNLGKENYKKAEQAVARLKQLATQATKYTPLKQKEDPNLDLVEYENKLKSMRRILDKLMMSIVHKDHAQTHALLDKLNKLKKAGHKQFRLDCD